jgi:hypothetical protein
MAEKTALMQTISRPLALRAAGFAAIVHRAEGEEALGLAAAEDALPKALRRRLSLFDQGVARCLIGLAQPGVEEEIVCASRYGNMALTLDLLGQLIGKELLSPAKFSMSVHNAAVGAASQILANRAGHTAIAAGQATLSAGLTEAWGRIAAGSQTVLFVYCDVPLGDPYQPYDEAGDGVQMALRLRPGDERAKRGHGEAGHGEAGHGEAGHQAGHGRTGAQAMARALAAGAEAVTWRP